MGDLFAPKQGNMALREREKSLQMKERQQASELASLRKASSLTGRSKTLFSEVLGIDAAIGKKTTLG